MKSLQHQGPSWADMVDSFSGSRTEVNALVERCRFFSSDDVMTWALQAYRSALAHLRKSEGEWVEEGCPWSSPHGFAEDVSHEFQRRVWDACERSAVYREVERWKDERAVKGEDFVAVQGDKLPQRGDDGASVHDGGAR